MRIMSRAEAKMAGAKTYYTGKPCRHGHNEARRTVNGSCVVCSRKSRREYVARHSVEVRNYMAGWRQRNPDLIREYANRRNKDDQRRYSREYRIAHLQQCNEANRTYKIANPDKVKQWRITSQERNREKRISRQRRFNQENHGKVKAWRSTTWDRIRNDHNRLDSYRRKYREYYDQNSVAVRAYQADYSKKNPDKKRAWGQARLAREAAACGRGISVKGIQRLTEDQNGLCAYCRKPSKLTVDHVECLSGGGSHDVRNAVMACKSCNSMKKDAPLAVFLERLAERRPASSVEDIYQLLATEWRHHTEI